MPFDAAKGEIIGGLGADYMVAPLDRWAGTDLFARAYDAAVEAFLSAGAMMPFRLGPDQILVQEYNSRGKLAFLFQLRIAGKEHFYPYVFDLPPEMIATLRMTGRWGKPN